MELGEGVAIGPYRLVQRAGTGGMAEVWRAFDARLKRYVAIKFLSPRYAGDPTYLERFNREAQAVSRLDHPNILTIHDYGEQDGWTYMVSPFIGGGTLDARLRRGPWSVDEAVAILEPLASALDYAHGQGIVHRDVKPSNVLFTEQGRLVLSDFGIARALEGSTMLSQAGLVVGTPMYMSPEQADGQRAGPASDLYSLGVVAYEMLTGRPPFMGETPLALLLAHMQKPLPPPRSLNSSMPDAVEGVLFTVLAKDPTHRYPSALEFVAALRAATPQRKWAPSPEPPIERSHHLRDDVSPVSPIGTLPTRQGTMHTAPLPPGTTAVLPPAAPTPAGTSGRVTRRHVLVGLGALAAAGAGVGALALGVPGISTGLLAQATATPIRKPASTGPTVAVPLPQVRLGVLVPRTGASAPTGAEALASFETQALASESFYAVKWQFISSIEDDADDPARAADAARRLVDQDKVAVAISLSGPGAAEAAAPIFQRAGIPLVTAFARTPALSSAGDFVFAAYMEHASLPVGRAAGLATARVSSAVARVGEGDRARMADSRAIREALAQLPVPTAPR